MSEIKSLKEVVETLIEREYENETGKLIDDEDFRLLAEFAGIKVPTKTDQQRRDEIVERSKLDIIELRIGGGDLYTVPYGGQHGYFCYADFITNREKRTVVALLRGHHTGKVRARGIAKCHPNDCFNVHIGKAIALRRALGLEVPDEYLNAPQPTEVRVGDVVEIHHTNGEFWCTDTVIRIRDDGALYLKDTGIMDFIPRHGDRIIDDSREGERE